MPLLVAKQLTDEWFAARLNRITASVAATCLDLDPDGGPLTAYSQIVGTRQKQTSSALAWGTKQEAEARRRYEELTGNLVFETGFWVSEDYDWLGASPDGLIGEDGMLEIKCPLKEYERPTPVHMIQVQIGLYCARRQWCDLFYCQSILPDGKDEIIRIEYDDCMVAELIARLCAFYRDHVATKTPPPRRKPRRKIDGVSPGPTGDNRVLPIEGRADDPAPGRDVPRHDGADSDELPPAASEKRWDFWED